MHRRILHVLAVAFILTPLSSYSQDVSSDQIRTAPLPEVNSAEAQESLQTGYDFERKQQWADALVHYEEATRRFPANEVLKQRLRIVRIRFDLSRRYADDSFVQSTRRLGVNEAIELFNEVCLKIQSHYVEPPNWRSLVVRGNRNLEIALRDRDFLDVHGRKISEDEVVRFVRYLFQRANEQSLSTRDEAASLVRTFAMVGEAQLAIPAVATVLEFVCGAASGLDDYSTFLTQEELDDVYSQIEGNFVGLGIELKANAGSLLITNVIRGGPADRAGILASDRIVEVNKLSMKDISTEKAADLLKGEQGSVVQVVVQSPEGSHRRLNVRRERVEVPSVEDVRMIDSDSGIGYLKLTSFQKTTSRDVDAALWSLHRQGMRSLIVDVRGNPGGLLTQSVEIADKFVMDGTIVSTRGRSPREDFDYKANRTGTWRVALVVLIDGDSASASEIFAGAIRDHRRGTIVGVPSYGKGSVQGIFPLRVAKTGVKLTTAKFYSPSGKPISNHGVEPDVLIRRPAASDESRGNYDATLSAGVEVARQQLAQRP